MSDRPHIDLQHVGVERHRREVVRDVSLTIGRAELVSLVGLNGAGKTTLLSLLATLAVPSRGRIFIDDIDVVAKPAQARARIGVVFQESALELRLSVLDNLLFIAQLQGLRGAAARARVDELLALFALDTLAARPVQCLSGGQRRRVELARALVARPPVLLLDEAALGLDVAARDAFWTEIRKLVANGHTVLHTTHHTEEADAADRVLILDEGALVADGSWAHLCRPVPDEIQLRVHDTDDARRWLSSHGYAVKANGQFLTVSCADARAEAPGLLRQMPTEILGIDIVAPDLRDVIAHWSEAHCRAAPEIRVGAASEEAC